MSCHIYFAFLFAVSLKKVISISLSISSLQRFLFPFSRSLNLPPHTPPQTHFVYPAMCPFSFPTWSFVLFCFVFIILSSTFLCQFSKACSRSPQILLSLLENSIGFSNWTCPNQLVSSILYLPQFQERMTCPWCCLMESHCYRGKPWDDLTSSLP